MATVQRYLFIQVLPVSKLIADKFGYNPVLQERLQQEFLLKPLP